MNMKALGIVTTLAGSGLPGFVDGPFLYSMFKKLSAITMLKTANAGNVLYATDYGSNRIRAIDSKLSIKAST